MSKKYNFYADGGSTGLPAGTEQHYVNHYLNEGASAGVFEQGGSLVDGYLTDPNFGDFQAGIYDKGGQIDTKNITIAKRIKVKKWYLKTYPKDDLGKEIREDITFWSLWAYMSQGYDVYNILGVGDSMIRERVFEELSKILGVDYDVIYQKWLNSDEYAMGGSLGNHGLKQGDQIIKTMSGGVQKVKTKSGDIVYVNLANGYRGAEPPMPFKNGGRLKSALVRDRKNVNYNEDYEVRYSKDKPSRSGYTKPKMSRTQFEDESFEFFADGGLIGKEVTFMSQGEKDRGIIGEVNEDGSLAVDTGRSLRLVEKDEIVEIHDKPKKRGFFFADGGVTKNYIDRNQLNTITIKKGDQKLTYKVSDVYNGAYKLEDGGNLEKTAFYVSKRNVVKVQLKNGKDVKVANGYWIKKGAKQIHASKYDDGGQLEMKFAGGGKIETKIQKKVDEVNALIKKAIDSDGDPLMVVDTTGTWEEPMQYKPIVYKNGRLYIEYFEPYSGKTEKDVINKSNMDFDGYPTLLNIAKMYRKALKEKGISYAGGGDTKMVDGVMYEKVKFTNGIEDWYLSSDLHRVNFYCQENGLNPKNQKDFEKAYSVVKKYEGGGKTTFKEKATAIAKNFEGKKVKPKYQKEYGKTYDKAEAKEVGNKIAGSQKAKYDSKMSGGGKTKRGGAMVLAKQIRKDGESWASALKRANEQMRKK
jgi:hypothetical protein